MMHWCTRRRHSTRSIFGSRSSFFPAEIHLVHVLGHRFFTVCSVLVVLIIIAKKHHLANSAFGSEFLFRFPPFLLHAVAWAIWATFSFIYPVLLHTSLLLTFSVHDIPSIGLLISHLYWPPYNRFDWVLANGRQSSVAYIAERIPLYGPYLQTVKCTRCTTNWRWTPEWNSQ